MIVQIKSVSEPDSWYSNAVGEKFNIIFAQELFFYAGLMTFPILKNDAEIVSLDPEEIHI